MRNYYKITFVFGITIDFDDNPSLLVILCLQNRHIIIECGIQQDFLLGFYEACGQRRKKALLILM